MVCSRRKSMLLFYWRIGQGDAHTGWSRIVSSPQKRGGHRIFTVCTNAGTLSSVTNTRARGTLSWKDTKTCRWGDLMPPAADSAVKDVDMTKYDFDPTSRTYFAKDMPVPRNPFKLREVFDLALRKVTSPRDSSLPFERSKS
eukprot:m.541428 g.541428  ORF g.541428 m.541428 type:complete len:142 (-) comp57648_c0_seq13:404-829(-)